MICTVYASSSQEVRLWSSVEASLSIGAMIPCVVQSTTKPLAFPNLGCVDRRYPGPHEWERWNGLQLEGQKGDARRWKLLDYETTKDMEDRNEEFHKYRARENP
ncbi:hypothetical protein TNCV_206761 [Trichonephila clavipes]|nr:hypothetical protein TNCV_206761 [Trichonephila clavipes]